MSHIRKNSKSTYFYKSETVDVDVDIRIELSDILEYIFECNEFEIKEIKNAISGRGDELPTADDLTSNLSDYYKFKLISDNFDKFTEEEFNNFLNNKK